MLGCTASVTFTPKVPSTEFAEKSMVYGLYSEVPVSSPIGKVKEAVLPVANVFLKYPVPVVAIMFDADGVPVTLPVSPNVKLKLPKRNKPEVSFKSYVTPKSSGIVTPPVPFMVNLEIVFEVNKPLGNVIAEVFAKVTLALVFVAVMIPDVLVGAVLLESVKLFAPNVKVPFVIANVPEIVS